MPPTTAQAAGWLQRWDDQQRTYIADREERFEIITDVVDVVADRPDPLVIDLGCGPGSLGVRLLDRLPKAEVVGVDGDPLLLGLGAAAYADRGGLRFVDVDLRTGGWADALGLDRVADAVVSTTALHWLTGGELTELYAACSRLLRPGGVLIDGDHLHDGPAQPALDRLTREIGNRHELRVGLPGADDWAGWWDAVLAAPELADLAAERGARSYSHHVDPEPTLADHRTALHVAGFGEIGTVWQAGANRVLVAVR